MLIGYARVSTHDQNLDLQRDALEKAGCGRIYVEHISGSSSSRSELERTIEILREGDTLVVWRLDRLGRSLKHLRTVRGDDRAIAEAVELMARRSDQAAGLPRPAGGSVSP